MFFDVVKTLEPEPANMAINKPCIFTDLGRYHRALKTADHVFYVNYQEGDENACVKMYNYAGKLISDNYFGYNYMFEVVEDNTYTWASKTMKENIRLHREANQTELAIL